MNDLIRLDSLSGESIRQARKTEVSKIQSIMDGIEALQQQIHKMELEIKPAVEEIEKKEAEKERMEKEKEIEKIAEQERIPQEKAEAEARENQYKQLQIMEDAQQQRQDELRSSIEKQRNQHEIENEQDIENEEPESQSPWRRLKLEVDLTVHDKPQAFIITGNLPGMKQKDIKIRIDENKLIISGFREPNELELQQMTRALTARGFVPRNKVELLTALLKMGVGRFGTFQQTYQLPRDGSVDTSKIEGQYSNNVLRVVVPKVVTARPTPSFNSRQQYPQYPGFGGNLRGFPQRNNRGFYQDPSVWW